MVSIAAEAEIGRHYCLDQIGQVFEKTGSPLLGSVFQRNRSTASPFYSKSRALRQYAGLRQFTCQIRIAPLQKYHYLIDHLQIGPLETKHRQSLPGERLLRPAHCTQDRSQTVTTEQAQNHFNAKIHLLA